MATINEEPKTKTPVPLGIVCGLLHKHTEQRNHAEISLHYANIQIRESKEGHIATLGRIVKYEGLPIIDEALEYAKTAGLFIPCNSKFVDIKTIVGNYTTKAGKTYKAHFTNHNKFLEKCKKGDEEPKYYNGYFLYKTYADKFEPYRNNSVKSFNKIEDLFDFTEIFEIYKKKSCDNGECKGGRAFAVKNNDKMFCCAGCLNKGLNLKPTDEDYWTEEEEDFTEKKQDSPLICLSGLYNN
jgi:hypothetical protein